MQAIDVRMEGKSVIIGMLLVYYICVSMGNKELYSIGHGTRKIEDFLVLLKKFDIHYLIDVRSQPYSKFNPQFNQAPLQFYLKEHKVTYVFMGDALGGRPEDKSCYDEEGKVDYTKIKEMEFYKEGLTRLKKAYQKGKGVAIMCSESKPTECHRSKLIGMSLLEDESEKIILRHIDEKGKVKAQATVMNELNKGLGNRDLFNHTSNTTSRKSYA